MIERQRYLLDFALRSLLRRKGKTAALLLVYVLVVFLPASVLFFTHALQREAALLLTQAPEIVVQRTLAGRHHPVPLGWADRIGRIAGVQSARARLWGYQYDRDLRANYTLTVPAEHAPAPGSVEIGNGIGRIRGANPGDTLILSGHDGLTRSYKVGKVLDHDSQLLTADLILMSERDYRDLTGISADHGTDIAVAVANPREAATIAEKIARIYPESRPVLRAEILRSYDAVFGWRSSLVLLLFGAAGLAFAILAFDKASGLSAEERKEIGILKAIGWESSDLLLMKLWEGFAVSLTAFLAGVLLAYLHTFVADSPLYVPVLKGWSVLYPQFHVTPYLDLGQVATLFLCTVVPYTVATVVPCWQAATVDPDAVMR